MIVPCKIFSAKLSLIFDFVGGLNRYSKTIIGILTVFGVILTRCGSENNSLAEEEESIMEISGPWKELNGDTLNPTIWEFENDEVKWKGFGHTFQLSPDALTISGIPYHIYHWGEDTVRIKRKGEDTLTLVRDLIR